ncbi:MAG TPA: MarR family winged helix-turn-helix transcriptional regulator [Cytophagales bacterium]|nr:MarR family winged helix-turn-helix transcriptional regulator [Cytophagales bacterium]
MDRSVYDTNEQGERIESKIVVALERISEAFRVLLWNESKDLGLSPIQIQILIFIRMHPTSLCKISYLAEEFKLTKPTISDAVKSLEQKMLVLKYVEPHDSRSYTLHLTEAGIQLAERLSSFSNVIKRPVEAMSSVQKTQLWFSLLTIINSLRDAGIISVQRNCQSCYKYENKGGVHYCHLMQKTMLNEDLKLDCPDHAPAVDVD